MDKGLTVPKMGADESAENTLPKCPKIYLSKPKSLGIRMKKASLGVCSPWGGGL